MKWKDISYWVATGILVFGVLSGGLAELIHRQDNVDGILKLGYPLYVVTLLGFWKVVGSIAVLMPRFPRLKEWAYAGIFFNMSGAFVSHAVCGSPAFHLVWTGIFSALTLISWALRPGSRMLGKIGG